MLSQLSYPPAKNQPLSRFGADIRLTDRVLNVKEIFNVAAVLVNRALFGAGGGLDFFVDVAGVFQGGLFEEGVGILDP